MIQFFSKRLYKNKKGFTIIELLVVIALLGILAGIAVPRMTGLTEGAKTKADAASMQTILRDVQVGIASEQIKADDIAADGAIVDGTDYLGDIPTSQISDADFVVKAVLADGVYTITVSNGTTTVTGVAEKIDN